MRANKYPVPGRSALRNRRLAGHEIGHAFCMAALGDPCWSVSIIPGDGFEGCVRSAPASPVSDLQKETGDILSICERLKKLAPKLGSARSASAGYYIFIQSIMIALFAGQCSEALLHPDLPPLGTDHDDVEAHAYAEIAVVDQGAVEALVAYCRAEAMAILMANRDVVEALVEALVDAGELSGEEVDGIILNDPNWKTTTTKLKEVARG